VAPSWSLHSDESSIIVSSENTDAIAFLQSLEELERSGGILYEDTPRVGQRNEDLAIMNLKTT